MLQNNSTYPFCRTESVALTYFHHMSWMLLLLCLLSGITSSSWIAYRVHISAYMQKLNISRYLILASINDIVSCVLYFGYFGRVYSNMNETALPFWYCYGTSTGVVRELFYSAVFKIDNFTIFQAFSTLSQQQNFKYCC